LQSRPAEATVTDWSSTVILHNGIKNMLRCDSGDVVGGIVSFVLLQRRSLRLAAALLTRAKETVAADAVMLLNGIRCFLSVHPPGSRCGAITVARLANERRAIAELMRLAPHQRWSAMTFGLRLRVVIAALPQLARTVPTWRRIARISRIVNRRHGAFRAYRVVELLFYYQRYVQLFASHAFQMAVISSHSNPHGIALNLAARRFGVPVVLITHGMPISTWRSCNATRRSTCIAAPAAGSDRCSSRAGSATTCRWPTTGRLTIG
jgi:hypothetical protein